MFLHLKSAFILTMKAHLSSDSNNSPDSWLGSRTVAHRNVYLLDFRIKDTSLFRKVDRFCGPASTYTVQNLVHIADAGRTLTQDCPAPPIDSLTGHYTKTSTDSSSLWLSFLAIVRQGRAAECTEALNGTSTHCHAYWKYTRNLWSRDTSLLRTL